MFKLSWLFWNKRGNRAGKSASRRPATCKHNQVSLTLVQLEDRTLPSTSVPLNSSTWTPVGPAAINNPDNPVAGRITGIAASPTDPNTIYIAAAGGGVWKTTDGGVSWNPLTDNQASLNMGSIAIAPSNTQIIYAGTGEASTPYLDSSPGHGVLKSTDGGNSWTLLGQFDGSNNPLFERRSIAKIVVDPNDANTVYVAVADFATGALTGNTGIWKSTDGGTTWNNTTTSASARTAVGDPFIDLVMDPTNDQVLYGVAANPRGNSRNGVYKTTDAGVHWAVAGNFPVGGNDGRISLAISPTNNQVLYAMIANTANNQLLAIEQTTNGGISWMILPGIPADIFSNKGPAPNGQGFYDNVLAVDPTDPTGNTFYAAGSAGANSIIQVVVNPGPPLTTTVNDISGGPNSPHADHHALAFDSNNQLLDGDDGGIWRLNTLALTWENLNSNLQITEFTGIALDPTNANIAYGGSQDNGTERFNDTQVWTQIRFGDGGFVRVDPTTPTTIYHEYSGVGLERSDTSGSPPASWITISPPGATGGLFYVPYVMDPSNSQRLLYGTATLYETTNQGGAWTAIGTPGRNGFNSGGGNIGAIAVSPSSPNTVYVVTGASNTAGGGSIFMTTNDGASWTNVGSPPGGSVADLEVDPIDNNTLYAVRNAFGGGHVFRSTISGGTHWTDISGTLPDLPTYAIVRGPGIGTLYIGTSNGVYGSTDGGLTWAQFGTGLPNVRVTSLEMNFSLNVLAAGTYGRGMYEMNIAEVHIHRAAHMDFCDGSPLEYTVDTSNLERLAWPLTYHWAASPGVTVYTESISPDPTVALDIPANFTGDSVSLKVLVTDVNGFQVTDTIQIPIDHSMGHQPIMRTLAQEVYCHARGVVMFNPYVDPLWDPLRDLVADFTGGTIQQLTLGQNAAGRLELFALGGNGQIYHKLETATDTVWGSWASLGSGFVSFALGVNANGRQELFALNQDHALFSKAQLAPSGAWASAWTHLTAPSLKQIRTGRNQDGRLELFGLGLDNTLTVSAQLTPSTDRWRGWISLHSPALQQVFVGQEADG